ncbi:amyloid fiber anchoring/assembly protein TapA [Virgibacillus halodenitrificans]|uniref:amyloid fiber anchoring/assembly protein TapA n=1 Tax=Virgibacillus halodenitrificans TaxID=1482 RepID=UPI00136C348D|nr:amyloid fiber anchoring/assembly protein TapA [Virgibacillus halodenitrificans]MYL45212.1 amyloid fiber anchoring/assembly protein TapA [Virgibacillus halodenitrificans]
MFNERGKKTGRKKLVIAAKLVVSMYVLLFTIGYLTSNTGAFFNDKEKEELVIEAGTWWDGSKLDFTGEPGQSGTCPAKTISVTLQNEGAKMLGSTIYKIYFAETGDPKTGEIIKSGTIEELEENGTTVLNYENMKEGTYQFSVLQREGFPDEKQIWSEEIVVTCEEPEAQPTEDDFKASEETSSNQEKEDEPKQADESESNQNQASYEQEELKNKKAETESKETTKSNQTTDAQEKLQEHKETEGAQQESESKEQDQAASLADEETKKGANEDTGKEQKNEPAN